MWTKKKRQTTEEDKSSGLWRNSCCKRLLSRRLATADIVRLVPGARPHIACYVNAETPEIRTVIYIKW